MEGAGYPDVRLRRLRRTEALRDMFAMPKPGPEKFIWPVFVVPGTGRREPIASMPGQFRLSADELVKELAPVVAQGVKSVLLFGQHEGGGKDACGTPAEDPRGAVQRAIPVLRAAYPDLVILTDVCLCAYTSHGHCGPRDAAGDVDNDAACEMLARCGFSLSARRCRRRYLPESSPPAMRGRFCRSKPKRCAKRPPRRSNPAV